MNFKNIKNLNNRFYIILWSNIYSLVQTKRIYTRSFHLYKVQNMCKTQLWIPSQDSGYLWWGRKEFVINIPFFDLGGYYTDVSLVAIYWAVNLNSGQFSWCLICLVLKKTAKKYSDTFMSLVFQWMVSPINNMYLS